LQPSEGTVAVPEAAPDTNVDSPLSTHRLIRNPTKTTMPSRTGGRAMSVPFSLSHPGGMERRALALWPRLDRAALRRCHADPDRIAALVARRTALPPDAIRAILLMPEVSEEDAGTWFG
jgi:hypothetical protein